MTPLVRFPHTPLEFEPAPDAREVDRAARRILRVAKEAGFDGRMAAGADELAVCDLMLRPPAPEFYGAWAETVLEGHFVYREEIPSWFARHWWVRLGARGWDPSRLDRAYGVSANRTAPWARVTLGIRRPFLEAQYGRNKAHRELVPQGLVREAAADPALVRRWTEGWKSRQAAEVSQAFSVVLGPRAVAAGRDMVAAALARAFMLEDPAVAQGYRGYGGSWWADRSGRPGFCAVEGEDLLTLRFLPSALEALDRWDEGAWSRVAERFRPFGQCRSLTPDSLPQPESWCLEARAPWALDGNRLLTSRGLKHTLRRTGPGEWVYELPPATLKKDWFRSLTSVQTPEGWVHRFEPGARWDERVFFEEGFLYPAGGGASLVRLVATAGSPRPH